MFLYLCVCVTLDVKERCPDVQQRIMSPFVDHNFNAVFTVFYRKNGLSNCVQRFQLYHWVAPQFSTESVKKIFKLKTDRKVCAHDFDHLGGAYNYRASICEGGLGSRNSVRLPVCPSVRLPYAWIVTKLNDALQIF